MRFAVPLVRSPLVAAMSLCVIGVFFSAVTSDITASARCPPSADAAGTVEDVHLDRRRPGRGQPVTAVRGLVDRYDIMAGRMQLADQRHPDGAGCAGEQDSHFASSR